MTLTFTRGSVAPAAAPKQSRPEASDLDRGFEDCFAEHYSRVVAYGLRRLPDRAAAEDAAAETFLIAWRRFGDAPRDQLPWLFSIARNVIFNQSRSSRRRQSLAARFAADRSVIGPTADAGGIDGSSDERAAQSALVWAAIERLSGRDREILLLTSWDGLTTRRAAAALGCSLGTFAVRLHRARGRLARALDAPAPSDPSTPGES